MTGSPVPMFVLPCACGIVWYSTRADSSGTCGEVEEGKRSGFRTVADLGAPEGCGRTLPTPIPEAEFRRMRDERATERE